MPESSELVSIIIPIYKVEPYIEDCIKSVLNQTYRALEIILVDDCGGDQSIQLAEKLLQHSAIAWKTVCHEHNRGLSAARNTGADAATGKYLYFLDSDDYIAPQTIETMLQAIEKHQTDVVIGGGIVLLMPDNSLAPIWKDTEADLHLQKPLTAYLRKLHNFAAWHRLINTEAYRAAGISFREGIVHEDIIWSFDMAKAGLSICSAPGKELYYYRQREGSIMTQAKQSKARLEGYVESIRSHYQYMMENNLVADEDFCHMYTYLFHECVHMIMSNSEESFRTRCNKMRRFLAEFSQPVEGMRLTHARMSRFVTLARFMPARLALKLS